MKEYWSRLPFPSPGDLTHPEIKLLSPALQVDSLLTELLGKPITSLTIPYTGFYNLEEGGLSEEEAEDI